MFSKLELFKKESGQAMIIAALGMVVVLGFAALVIDIGAVSVERRNLQNIADSAALGGAADLPNASTADTTAVSIANASSVQSQTVTPFEGDKTRIKVTVKANVTYTFARILGFTSTEVSASAVAQKNPKWSGEALPFLNLDDDYKTSNKIVAWEKTGPGDFESLWKDEYEPYNLGKNDDHSKGYFTVDYQNGIEITKGTVATIKQEVGYIYEQHKPLYIFSLSSDAIKKYTDVKLKNNDVIPLSDLVLLQVTFDSYDYSGKTLFLTVTGVYDINNGVFPTDYLNDSSQGTPILVK